MATTEILWEIKIQPPSIGSFSRILLEIRFNKKLFYFQWNKVDTRIYNTFIKIHLKIEAELMPIDVSKLYI